AGKQAAWNRAINESNGTYFICLDSDDALVNNSLSLIEKKLYLLETNDTIIGFRCLAISQKKQKPDSSFTPQKSDTCSWFDEFSSRIFGERIDVLKTRIIKDFLYPVKDNIKFIPEIWFYVMTAKCGYTFIYLNEPVRIFYDNHEHLRLSKSNLKKNAHGHYIARKAMLKYIPASVFFKNPIALIKTSIRYFQSIYFMYNRK
ncbi:TPA: glycosyltransferase family 2 protein, partial [Morganella morganii]|nr:glycosyltransferase family 2 protein [Morganella morganii]